MAILHSSHLFWLTILLVGSICFLFDYLIEYIRFNIYRNASDYVRLLVDSKIGEGMTSDKPASITKVDLDQL